MSWVEIAITLFVYVAIGAFWSELWAPYEEEEIRALVVVFWALALPVWLGVMLARGVKSLC